MGLLARVASAVADMRLLGWYRVFPSFDRKEFDRLDLRLLERAHHLPLFVETHIENRVDPDANAYLSLYGRCLYLGEGKDDRSVLPGDWDAAHAELTWKRMW